MPKKEKHVEIAQEIERDLRTIREIIRRPLEAEFARGNLTGPQQSVMHALVNSGGMSLKQLSAGLGLAHSTVSGIIDRLEKRGLVEREQNQADRRLTQIVITERVQKFLRETMPRLSLHPLAEAIGRAHPNERRTIVACGRFEGCWEVTDRALSDKVPVPLLAFQVECELARQRGVDVRMPRRATQPPLCQ